jgi:hypothetical protein
MAILALIEKEEVIWRMGPRRPRPTIPRVMFETRGHLPPPAWPELKSLCVVGKPAELQDLLDIDRTHTREGAPCLLARQSLGSFGKA